MNWTPKRANTREHVVDELTDPTKRNPESMEGEAGEEIIRVRLPNKRNRGDIRKR